MKGFSLDFVSSNEYEFLAIEVSYQGQLLLEINAEQGTDQLEVKFAHDSRLLTQDVAMRFPASEFLRVFSEACVAIVEANGGQGVGPGGNSVDG
jgi:hypothetical protein